MANILAVGIATIDIINTVDTYPLENTEVRALSQRKTRGGNATNTLVVLSQLGHRCHWAGILIEEADSAIIQHELRHFNIDSSACHIVSHGKMPTSYISISQQTGSRSIVHYRDCPEFSFADFKKIDLTQYDWIHFEGRNIEQLLLMLQYLQSNHPTIPYSLEVEKPRPGIEALFSYPTVLMFSQDYALSHQYTTAKDLLNSLDEGIIASCTWGSQGAWIINEKKQLFHSPAYVPEKVVDTLGAGDTFNAALIDGLTNKVELSQAVVNACKLAGYKCGQLGLASIMES
ncbi:MAG: PfkB family carbohydrate kinase [Gammaproteobacteria bacterium]|nr:PfkB family carbohydrate kinase [Gammaproteobacteria bacterium]